MRKKVMIQNVLLQKDIHTEMVTFFYKMYIFLFNSKNYTRDSFQREARASECSLQRAREGPAPYPICCCTRKFIRLNSEKAYERVICEYLTWNRLL